eukprot:2976411-Lingulodinium_polyedra.AAC.1
MLANHRWPASSACQPCYNPAQAASFSQALEPALLAPPWPGNARQFMATAVTIQSYAQTMQ